MKDRMVYIHAAYDYIQAIEEFTQGYEFVGWAKELYPVPINS